ncbi:uncharacterized protein BDZ99DRAFT_576980 [Mytilinidion resinicola]|uniref:Integral membrane protein n=1 Tax=Mytilinidion resinicola TaxID=574789 RepID=A0A6A6Y0I7_9PEZI|nr:uncharacterized protein BDZ99DRAFT_576980 [Mytilinidion resinicola]KAF2802282.1 hypothetical protein BDZ99DRAFT_576980 [Mytilinidion resinicola]
MSSPAPTFGVPDYEPESETGTGNAEPAAENRVIEGSPQATDLPQPASDDNVPLDSKSNPSRPSSSKQDSENDKIHANQIDAVMTKTDDTSSNHRLNFTETAKHAAGKVSRTLHLHRGENARGPSEARQRRQSRLPASDDDDDDAPNLPLYIHLRNAVYGSLIMFTTFPYWDMAFWSGWSYTWGSVLFVIDGVWAWTPLQWPSSEFTGESEYGVGLLFFFGAVLYQLGATMAYLEAINDGSFGGPAMKRHLEGHDDEKKKLLDGKLHMFFGHMIPHHHHHDDDDEDFDKQKSVDPEAGWNTRDRAERPGSIYPEDKAPAPRRGGVDMGPTDEGEFHEYLTWRWWPTWHALKTYHIKEIGYVACSIQLLGATLYGICGVIALPGILSNFQPWQELGGYWIPQTVASCCFLTAGVMFTLITQDKWYRPLPGRIAWWIGVWATIGSMGFLMSAAFGIRANDLTWCEYQSSLASVWGSFAYLVSSWLQWYESVNKGPVLAFPNNRIPTLMRDRMART